MKYQADLISLISPYNHRKREITASTTFKDFGMDTYEIIDFLVQVEKQFDIYIDDDAMLQLQTLQDVSDTIDKCTQEEI